jgi:hypothetical protein
MLGMVASQTLGPSRLAASAYLFESCTKIQGKHFFFFWEICQTGQRYTAELSKAPVLKKLENL